AHQSFPAKLNDTAPTSSSTLAPSTTGPDRLGSGERSSAAASSTVGAAATAWKWLTHLVGLKEIRAKAIAVVIELTISNRRTGSRPMPPRPLAMATTATTAKVSSTGRRRAHPAVFSSVL